MAESNERLSHFDRFMFILIGAIIAILLLVVLSGHAQVSSRSDSTLPVRVEDITSKSCKVSSLPQEPGKATGYLINYSWKYRDETWPEGKDFEIMLTPPNISTEANQKVRRKANAKCLDWMDAVENEGIRLAKLKKAELSAKKGGG
jgi:hypothetical protein